MTAELVYSALGLAGEKRTAQLMDAVARHDAKQALELFSGLYAGGKDIAAMLDELTALSRDLLVLKTAPKSGLTMLSGVTTDQEAMALVDKFTAAELLRITTVLQETAAGFVKSANRRIDAELCMLRLCDPGLDLDARSLNARISKIEDQLASGSFVTRQAAPAAEEDDRPPLPDDDDAPPFFDEDAPPVPAPAKQDDAPTGFVTDFLTRLKEEVPQRCTGFVHTSGSLQVSIEGNLLYLVVPGAFEKKMLDNPQVLEPASRIASGMLGRPITARCTERSKKAAPGSSASFNSLVSFGQEHNDVIKFTNK